jgi:broad specificity phosphatase PhoE
VEVVTTILLLRHGETDLNVRDVLRGHVDVPLSANGVREAHRLAERVAHEYRVSALRSSPLERARSTAQAIAEAIGVAIEIEDRFLDIDYGPWAGTPCDSFSAAEREEFRRWHRNPEVPLAGAEDPAEGQRRALAGLAAAAEAHQGCIAIVTHDAILQLLLCAVLGIDLRSYRGIVQHTATLNEMCGTVDRWKVRLLNSAWHVESPMFPQNG